MSLGIAFALGAAACWAAYILLTQRVGDKVAGLKGLAVSMPVAGLTATLVVMLLPGRKVFSALTPELLLIGFGLALLLPVIPFAFEMLALRRLTTAAFGTLMSLEPAFALVIGLIVAAPGAEPARGDRHRVRRRGRHRGPAHRRRPFRDRGQPRSTAFSGARIALSGSNSSVDLSAGSYSGVGVK